MPRLAGIESTNLNSVIKPFKAFIVGRFALLFTSVVTLEEKIMRSNLIRTFVLGIAMVSMSAAGASAATIYQDSFSGSASAPLNGTTPDITVGSNTFTAGTGDQADGSFNSRTTASLPFTPTTGNTYTLSSDLNVSSGAGNLLFFGAANSNVFNTNNVIYLRYDASTATTGTLSYGNGTNVNGGNTSAGTVTTGGTLSIVFNATTQSVQYFYNGGSVGTASYSASPLSAISTIGFSTGLFGNATGTIDNLSLTDGSGTPEPASMGLIGMGALTLLARRRK